MGDTDNTGKTVPSVTAVDEEQLIVGGGTFSEQFHPGKTNIRAVSGLKGRSTYEYHDYVNSNQDYKDNYKNKIKAYRNSNHSFSVS